MELNLSSTNVITIDDLRGDQFIQKAHALEAGLFSEYYIKRTASKEVYEGVLVSKARYDALIAGATDTVPSEDKHAKSDDFVIQNLMDVFDILNGRQQAGYNAQVAMEGTRYVVGSFAGTIPSGSPYVLDVGAVAEAPVTAAEAVSGSAVAVVSVLSSVVTFGAGDASKSVIVSFGDKKFAIYEIHRTLGTPTDPYCYLLSDAQYQTLLALQ